MKIFCIGDSLTAGYGVDPSECWVSLAQRSTGFLLQNYGVNGQSTGPMRRKLSRLLSEAPDGVFVMGGVNDLIFRGLDRGPQAIENIRAMITEAREKGACPVLGLAPGICPRNLWPQWRACFDPEELIPPSEALRKQLRQLAGDLSVPTIDFETALRERSAFFDLQDLLYDGLHPNARGHAIMAHLATGRLLSLFSDAKTGN